MPYGVDLSKKENWTPLRLHIWRTGMLIGFGLGVIITFWTAFCLWFWLYA